MLIKEKIQLDIDLLQKFKQCIDDTITNTPVKPKQEIVPHLTFINKVSDNKWDLVYTIHTPRHGYTLDDELISINIPEKFIPLCKQLYPKGSSSPTDPIP